MVTAGRVDGRRQGHSSPTCTATASPGSNRRLRGGLSGLDDAPVDRPNVASPWSPTDALVVGQGEVAHDRAALFARAVVRKYMTGRRTSARSGTREPRHHHVSLLISSGGRGGDRGAGRARIDQLDPDRLLHLMPDYEDRTRQVIDDARAAEGPGAAAGGREKYPQAAAERCGGGPRRANTYTRHRFAPAVDAIVVCTPVPGRHHHPRSAAPLRQPVLSSGRPRW